jgi:hypothetical protein
MGEGSGDAFDQDAFSASAAALVASHAMSDVVWKTYFPELPAKQPELRTVLIMLHKEALAGRPLIRSQAYKNISDLFQVEWRTAQLWIRTLMKLGFVVTRQTETKESAYHVFPSARAKNGLFKVGSEYLVCLRLVGQPLRDAIDGSDVDVNDLDWLDTIKDLIEQEAEDYKTFNIEPVPSSVKAKKPQIRLEKSTETYSSDEERD